MSLGFGVVDVQKGNRILAITMPMYSLKGLGRISTSQDTGFPGLSGGCSSITGHETELCLDSGPAFSSNGHIFAVSPCAPAQSL